ncbi:hypothetical protein HMPREF7215_1616 [Pyramidobacter piscolens W5455]|uniref:Uncharacterized protein n=1 Tax=Pyramidobacter piscolens W5455 TaxID=352165 RepID=A0ABM9ZW78_9BACT|nr:hypothetical protein HMPREF7215_1616 [Pyramidobacter piscolens W5455]
MINCLLQRMIDETRAKIKRLERRSPSDSSNQIEKFYLS